MITRAATFNYSHQDPEIADVLEAIGLRPEILEIKCPLSARNLTIKEAISSCKGFCLGKFIVKTQYMSVSRLNAPLELDLLSEIKFICYSHTYTCYKPNTMDSNPSP